MRETTTTLQTKRDELLSSAMNDIANTEEYKQGYVDGILDMFHERKRSKVNRLKP